MVAGVFQNVARPGNHIRIGKIDRIAA